MLLEALAAPRVTVDSLTEYQERSGARHAGKGHLQPTHQQRGARFVHQGSTALGLERLCVHSALLGITTKHQGPHHAARVAEGRLLKTHLLLLAYHVNLDPLGLLQGLPRVWDALQGHTAW